MRREYLAFAAFIAGALGVMVLLLAQLTIIPTILAQVFALANGYLVYKVVGKFSEGAFTSSQINAHAGVQVAFSVICVLL